MDPQDPHSDEGGDLLSPIPLASLNLPESSSSLTVAAADSDDVSPTAVVENPYPAAQGLNSAPPADIKKMVADVKRAEVASSKLQEVFGLSKSPAQPFRIPPVMPPNLIEKFEAGLKEYGLADDKREMGKSKGKGKMDLLAEIASLNLGQQQQQKQKQAPPPPSVLFPSPNISSSTKIDVPGQLPVAPPPNVDGFLQALFSRPPPAAPPKVLAHKLGHPPPSASANASSSTTLGQLNGKDRKRARAESKDLTESSSTAAGSTSASAQQPQDAQPASQEQQKKHKAAEIGMVTLPASFTLAWTPLIPGNTLNLAQTLFRWHHTMTTLYRRCSEESIMQIHPLFPYQPSPVVAVPLVSASFWDTSSEPHREMRFMGPGDVSGILYAEVDTFILDSTKEEQARNDFFTKVWTGNEGSELRNIDMRARNDRGEGRWCFIVINGLKKDGEPKEAVRPCLVLAWPVTANTSGEDCVWAHIPWPGRNVKRGIMAGGLALKATGAPQAVWGMKHMRPDLIATPGTRDALRSATSSTLPPPKGTRDEMKM
jgi:hypothetical protein